MIARFMFFYKPGVTTLPFEIMCDASDYAVGAVLGQTKDKKHLAIAYASKTLVGAQLKCDTRFIKEHKPNNHIRTRIKSHVYTTE